MSATSSNHAKILAIHEASRECVWLRSVTQHIRESCGISSGQESPTVVHEDNATCIAQLKDRYIKGDKTNHILPKFFFTHDLQKSGDIIIQKVVEVAFKDIEDMFEEKKSILEPADASEGAGTSGISSQGNQGIWVPPAKLAPSSSLDANFAMRVVLKLAEALEISREILDLQNGATILSGSRRFSPVLDDIILSDSKDFILYEDSKRDRDMSSSSSIGFTSFGGGLRLCPGLDLARLEASVCLHHFDTKFRSKRSLSYFKQSYSRVLQLIFSELFSLDTLICVVLIMIQNDLQYNKEDIQAIERKNVTTAICLSVTTHRINSGSVQQQVLKVGPLINWLALTK
ncbi:retrovirus-related pol polyprotein from transposon TNT 1-94 [Tanacetum coccineum]